MLSTAETRLKALNEALSFFKIYSMAFTIYSMAFTISDFYYHINDF